jgi:hypothetical protein
MESDQGIVKSKRREEPSVKPFTPTVKAAEEATLTSRLGERAKLAQLLDDITSTPATADLGSMSIRSGLHIGIPEPKIFSEYRVYYPEVVVQALANLFEEYNDAFEDLALKNAEDAQAYRYNYENGAAVNHFVQIDMMGLPEEFLARASQSSVEAVQEVLRARVFEIENSIAAYQLLSELFISESQSASIFSEVFRGRLDELREKHKRPIALLAVTDGKYNSMLSFEFGKDAGESVNDQEVYRRTGFDTFMGPQDFLKHIAENDGVCQYMLYVRASAPTERLKDPRVSVDNPLLSDSALRAIIRQNSLTFNIDAPDAPFQTKINDTKEYLIPMDMAYRITKLEDLFSAEFMKYMNTKNATWGDYQGATRLSPEFLSYLDKQGVSPNHVESGEVMLRAKPEKETYGCYGHVRGALSHREFKREVRRGLERRGAYVVQVEMKMPTIENAHDDTRMTYIDRNFFAMTESGPKFMGGFRSMMDVNSHEAKNGRIHGSPETVWAEILPSSLAKRY